MMIYVLKSAVTLALLYTCVYPLLSRETFHRFNRLMLLGIMVASLIVPLIRITISQPAAFHQGVEKVERYIATNSPKPSAVVSPARQAATAAPAPYEVREEKAFSFFPIWSILTGLYIAGVVLALALIAKRMISLKMLLRNGLRHTDSHGNSVILLNGAVAPFSLFHTIVMSVEDYEYHREPILTHEQEHIRLHHTCDLLFFEAVKTLQWFNPFVWFLGRELKAVHEYEADEAVIRKGIDAIKYQQFLVIKAVGNRLQPFANNLNRNSLKKRIMMMHQKPSSRRRMLKALFAIPVVALALYAFAKPEVATAIVKNRSIYFIEANDDSRTVPLVSYMKHQKWGESLCDYYLVRFHAGVWVVNDGKSFIEEQYFDRVFDNTKGESNMLLNGKTFDQNSLPKLANKDLKKIEITTHGERQTVNLVTTDVKIPDGIEGNAPHAITLFLPGNGVIHANDGRGTPGDWMHWYLITWGTDEDGWSVKKQITNSIKKPDFKVYIYASARTSPQDVMRAKSLMKDLGISNYEVKTGLPIEYLTEAQLAQWARSKKAQGLPYEALMSKFLEEMSRQHKSVDKLPVKYWLTVKKVYGIPMKK